MVHAVHAGITQFQMLVITLTKFFPVVPSPRKRAFAFLLVDRFTKVFNLGGFDRCGGGNRYQGSSLILSSLDQVLLGFNHVLTLFTKFHFMFSVYFRKSLINKVCSMFSLCLHRGCWVKLGFTWLGLGSFSQ